MLSPCHTLFKGHNVIVDIVVLNCQKCNQCQKCQVSGHKSLGSENLLKIWRKKTVKNLKIFRKSEILSKIWFFFKSLKICRKLSSKISRVTCISECSMIVFFNNGCQLLTQSVTYLLSDKGIYWVVWGQLKISISDIFQVSVISIYQSMPGARGRPKNPLWSQTWRLFSYGGLVATDQWP